MDNTRLRRAKYLWRELFWLYRNKNSRRKTVDIFWDIPKDKQLIIKELQEDYGYTFQTILDDPQGFQAKKNHAACARSVID